MQGLACHELLSHLSLERRAVGSVLRHGFHPPEAEQGWSNPTPQSVHPKGRTPIGGPFCARCVIAGGCPPRDTRSDKLGLSEAAVQEGSREAVCRIGCVAERDGDVRRRPGRWHAVRGEGSV